MNNQATMTVKKDKKGNPTSVEFANVMLFYVKMDKAVAVYDLFGAGDLKLATTLGFRTAKEGGVVKESFRTKLQAAGDLQDHLVKQWKENKYKRGGYIQVAGGTWVWCPSEHKLLNYLLMGSEAVVQNEAICWINIQMKKRGLHGQQLLSIHDELTFEFPIEEKEQGIKLMSQMYSAASKRLGLEVIIDGQAQAGFSWDAIH